MPSSANSWALLFYDHIWKAITGMFIMEAILYIYPAALDFAPDCPELIAAITDLALSPIEEGSSPCAYTGYIAAVSSFKKWAYNQASISNPLLHEWEHTQQCYYMTGGCCDTALITVRQSALITIITVLYRTKHIS